MRSWLVIVAEELRRAWRTPATYGLLALFCTVTGLLYLSVFYQASIEPGRYSPLRIYWEMQWLPNLMWVPLLTMRLLTVERRQGLLESTLATPTTPAAIVMGKYAAAIVLYLAGWALSGLFMVVTNYAGLSSMERAYVFELSAVGGGAIFCVASGAFFVALGLWCSSLSRNTILSGALTVCLMLLYMLLPTMLGQTPLAHWDWLRPWNHLQNLSIFVAGAIELSTVVAYMIGAAVLLLSAMLCIERKAE